jgi:excisionase family DNA binding protein
MIHNTALQIDGFTRFSLLKASEIAKILNVSTNLVYRLIQDGDLPSVRLGRAVRVKPADLEQFITRKTQGRTEPTVGLEDHSKSR